MKKKALAILGASIFLSTAGVQESFAYSSVEVKTEGGTNSTTVETPASINSYSVGSYGKGVTKLKEDLKSLGYYMFPVVTNIYDLNTRKAIKSFQADYGLKADGIAGPDTLNMISHALLNKTILEDAQNYIGTPYLWGGSTPDGFDSSGFVCFLLDKYGVYNYRVSSAVLFKQGNPLEKDDLRPGDLVFFNLGPTGKVDHVGFYVGDDKFISSVSTGISIQELDSIFWETKFAGARRIY
ncbi:C40 family peptidase [Paenibacillus taichungensis]